MLGKVVKLDLNMKNGARGRFARMAIYINLWKALVSQVMMNGVIQRVEYEHLPMVCFSYIHFGHVKEICPRQVTKQELAGVVKTPEVGKDNCNSLAVRDAPENTSNYDP